MPLRRILARIVVAGVEAVGKAVFRAVREEIRTSQQAASARSAKDGGTERETRSSTATNIRHGISVQEAMQILNVKDPLNPDDIQQRYDHLFSVNEKSKGGSFYLQSKVVRAKERIDQDLQLKARTCNENAKSDIKDEIR